MADRIHRIQREKLNDFAENPSEHHTHFEDPPEHSLLLGYRSSQGLAIFLLKRRRSSTSIDTLSTRFKIFKFLKSAKGAASG